MPGAVLEGFVTLCEFTAEISKFQMTISDYLNYITSPGVILELSAKLLFAKENPWQSGCK